MPSVAELASRAGVHPLHFARTFRRFQRCSPGEYLRRRRAERAAELILQTRLPLADVAQRSGFSDQSHLTRAMRRYFGATPARLRR
jgi:AraC family transcriptional regulator